MLARMMGARGSSQTFFGWRVVGAAFVLGVFGWGVGYYGPPIFLATVHAARGWPIALISGAVTMHFLVGALVAANLPALHRRFGAAIVTKAGAVCLAAGALGWASAGAPWGLFVAALPSGFGWGSTSASALNAIVSPWFARARPTALATAYNGGSIGGLIFSPLWVAAIGALGFAGAAGAVGVTATLATWLLADRYFSRTPQQMGLRPDGNAPDAPPPVATGKAAAPFAGSPWRDRRFATLAAGMALGQFAQMGLTAHLFSLLAPSLGAREAGFLMTLVTMVAVPGRSMVACLMPAGTNRRLVSASGYVAQFLGSLALAATAGSNGPLLLGGIVLFGIGFGNATSLPPLIAQSDFAERDVARAVALMVGASQGVYAFAPATFGLIRDLAPPTPGAASTVFACAALIQAAAAVTMLAGRRRTEDARLRNDDA